MRRAALKPGAFEQQNTNDHDKGDDRHHQPRGPVHAAAHPPQQRATHHDGNDDIEWQCTSPRWAERGPPELPTPMLKAPPIVTQVNDDRKEVFRILFRCV